MKIVLKTGNLLDAQTDVIAHQVNCQGVMGSGVAKQIKEKWPDVFEKYQYRVKMANYPVLGDCQLIQIEQNKFVANLFGQKYYGRENFRYTSYDAIYDALTKLSAYMQEKNCKSVAIPYKMSSDRGGADWNVILTMLSSVFKHTNITIEVWNLNGYTGCN
jgi:O-acetyl-ADP-ribose deacetylase (regulator of RNase III)